MTTSGGAYAGGFAGENNGAAISQSYSTGAVTASSSDVAGGFVGSNANSTIDESYETGAVTGGMSNYTGAFAGYNAGTIGGTTAVYYNTTANGSLPAQGSASSGTSAANGLTFAQMETATSRVAILTYTMPIWAVLLAWAVLGERPTRVQAAALARSHVGGAGDGDVGHGMLRDTG